MTGAQFNVRFSSIAHWMRAVGISSCAVLGGCMLNPEVPAPDLDVPANFTTGSLKIGGDQDKFGMAFEMFRSKQLVALITQARSSNLDIAAAAHRIEQADAQVRIATQPLIPLLDFSGNASQSYGGREPARGHSHNLNAALVASYEIDFWGKNQAGRASAEASVFSTRFNAAVIAIETDASVAQTYFQALALRKRLTIARKNLDSAIKTLEAIKAQKAAGTASGLDIAQQETLVANVRVTIPPLEQNYAKYSHALAVLLGMPPEYLKLDGEDLFSIRVPRLSAGLPSDLLYQRPDIAVAEANLAAAKFDVSAARAALFPSIKLTGEGGFESTALKALFRPDSLFYQMAAGLTQPLLSAYSLKAKEDFDRARYMELLENYRKAIIASFQDTEDALTAYKKTTEQENLQRAAVASARHAYDISTEQLKSGVIDLTTLLGVQRTLFSAEDALVEVRLQRLLSVVSLYKALGGGWQRPTEADIATVPANINTPAVRVTRGEAKSQ